MNAAAMQPETSAEFDAYAESYDEALALGLSFTGETKDYYASGRVAWLAKRLAERKHAVRSVMDFGCGTGSGVPFLFDGLNAKMVHGVDVSAPSLDIARATHTRDGATFAMIEGKLPPTFDLAFCNGVFHHIPVAGRHSAAAYVHEALLPGGLFALWENNPWNLGTRYIMSRVPFDRDAITLTPPETRRLLRDAGFDIVRTDYLFVFPHALRALRPLERWMASMPIGGQYLVLARKR
ncbi:MAG: methyltransferase domain-containing protein [Gemmatimonadaceae bacterium]|nr:methyltransferase domain-containing protein [Gemmatimonadaceae bacterium]